MMRQLEKRGAHKGRAAAVPAKTTPVKKQAKEGLIFKAEESGLSSYEGEDMDR
jgi:hypothetical protein